MDAAPEFLTIAEVAGLLRVSRAALDRWVKADKFPAPAKFGGAVQRFSRTAVLRFIEDSQTREPIAARTRKASRAARRGKK